MAQPIKQKIMIISCAVFKVAVRTANGIQATSSVHKPKVSRTLQIEGEHVKVEPSGARE